MTTVAGFSMSPTAGFLMSFDMKRTEPLAPAITEVNVLADMRFIEINQLMAFIARALQKWADPCDENLALFRLGTTQQFAGFRP